MRVYGSLVLLPWYGDCASFISDGTSHERMAGMKSGLFPDVSIARLLCRAATGYCPNAICSSSTTFSVRMTPTAHHPATFVRRALAKLLITEARLVNTSSGIKANG